MLSDIIAAIVVLAIVGGAIAYIVKQKRQGVKCIGCATGKAACAHAAASAGAGTAAAAANAGTHACACSCGSVDDMVARMTEAAETAAAGEVAAMGTTGMAETTETTVEKESCRC